AEGGSGGLRSGADGRRGISGQRIIKPGGPPQSRKRAIDVVLMSVGGNDVGFSALAAYSLTENMADLAPIASLTGSSSRFGPQVARAYLEVLDERMKAVKEALHDGFGVMPSRVVQTSYEPIQYDETGSLCGGQPALAWTCIPASKSVGTGCRRRRISCVIFSGVSNASAARTARVARAISRPAPAPASSW